MQGNLEGESSNLSGTPSINVFSCNRCWHSFGELIINVSFFVFMLFSLQHERFLHEAKVCQCDVLFIGDSIIRNMFETEVWLI